VLPEGPETALTVAGFGGEELELAVGVEGLPLAFLELRLVVPGVYVAQAAGAKNLDDRPRLWGLVRELWCEGVAGGSPAFGGEQGVQGHAAETAPALLEKVPARERYLGEGAWGKRVHALVQVNKLVGVE
jgi:hypothetical protein